MKPAALLLFVLAGAGAALLALRSRPAPVVAGGYAEPAATDTVEPAAAAFSAASVLDIVTAPIRKLFSLPDRAAPYAESIRAAEIKHGLPENLLARVLQQESRFRPDIIEGRTRSSAGAVGIAQFMPATAAELGVNPLDPFQSIDGAARYLRRLYNRFGDWPRALAAYNWGQGNVARRGLEAAPLETRNYVAQITADVQV